MAEHNNDEAGRFSRVAKSTPSVYLTAIVTVVVTVVATKAFDIPGWLMSDRQAIWDEVHILQNAVANTVSKIERIERDIEKGNSNAGEHLRVLRESLEQLKAHVYSIDRRMVWLHGPGEDDRRTLDEYREWRRRNDDKPELNKDDQSLEDGGIRHQIWRN